MTTKHWSIDDEQRYNKWKRDIDTMRDNRIPKFDISKIKNFDDLMDLRVGNFEVRESSEPMVTVPRRLLMVLVGSGLSEWRPNDPPTAFDVAMNGLLEYVKPFDTTGGPLPCPICSGTRLHYANCPERGAEVYSFSGFLNLPAAT